MSSRRLLPEPTTASVKRDPFGLTNHSLGPDETVWKKIRPVGAGYGPADGWLPADDERNGEQQQAPVHRASRASRAGRLRTARTRCRRFSHRRACDGSLRRAFEGQGPERLPPRRPQRCVLVEATRHPRQRLSRAVRSGPLTFPVSPLDCRVSPRQALYVVSATSFPSL